MVLDSAPPIAATLAADRLGNLGPDLLARIQRAHYVEGRRIAQPDVLCALAEEEGLDPIAFGDAFHVAQGQAIHAHIEGNRACWVASGAAASRRSPSNTKDGSTPSKPRPSMAGEARAWVDMLKARLSASAAIESTPFSSASP